MEELIIDWLVATVEADDKQREHLQATRTDGKRLFDTHLHGDREVTYDYITGEPVELPEDWDERWVYMREAEEEAYRSHPYPAVPKGLEFILRNDLDPEEARKWLNEHVMWF